MAIDLESRPAVGATPVAAAGGTAPAGACQHRVLLSNTRTVVFR